MRGGAGRSSVSFAVSCGLTPSSDSPPSLSQSLSPRLAHSRQEHCETQMLRKRVKELETECKQLQLECQVKEGRALELEGDVEVSFFFFFPPSTLSGNKPVIVLLSVV